MPDKDEKLYEQHKLAIPAVKEKRSVTKEDSNDNIAKTMG